MDSIPEDIAANLPPPRADEPASLRQDILDELRDHLQCAVRREQLLGATDPPTAWQRVLARFGNPTEIARKLYWQAMWSRIMQQRIVFAGGVGMLVACVAMAAFLWIMLDRQREFVLEQRAWAERQQANFETMLTRLNTPARMYGSLIVQVDHPVAKIRLLGGALKDPVDGVLVNPSDPDAPRNYDFGEMSPGIYELGIVNKNQWYLTQHLVIKSGESHLEEISVPDDGAQALITFTSNLRTCFTVNLPGELKKTFGGREWERSSYTAGVSIGPGTSPVAETELKGRVQLRLAYNLEDNGITAELGPPLDAQKTDVANCLYHVIEFDLKPGPNECHVELPEDWIRRFSESHPETAAPAAASAFYKAPAAVPAVYAPLAAAQAVYAPPLAAIAPAPAVAAVAAVAPVPLMAAVAPAPAAAEPAIHGLLRSLPSGTADPEPAKPDAPPVSK